MYLVLCDYRSLSFSLFSSFVVFVPPLAWSILLDPWQRQHSTDNQQSRPANLHPNPPADPKSTTPPPLTTSQNHASHTSAPLQLTAIKAIALPLIASIKNAKPLTIASFESAGTTQFNWWILECLNFGQMQGSWAAWWGRKWWFWVLRHFFWVVWSVFSNRFTIVYGSYTGEFMSSVSVQRFVETNWVLNRVFILSLSRQCCF
jgi:hypothetical protein